MNREWEEWIRDRSVRRDCLTAVLGAVILTGALLTVLVATRLPEVPPPRSNVVAREGEWITRPDGRRVCRVTRTISRYETLPATGWCSDWQETAPQYGQTVSGWARSSAGYFQIMVNGQWRP